MQVRTAPAFDCGSTLERPDETDVALMISIAEGTEPLSQCPEGDVDKDGEISFQELYQAITHTRDLMFVEAHDCDGSFQTCIEINLDNPVGGGWMDPSDRCVLVNLGPEWLGELVQLKWYESDGEKKRRPVRLDKLPKYVCDLN